MTQVRGSATTEVRSLTSKNGRPIGRPFPFEVRIERQGLMNNSLFGLFAPAFPTLPDVAPWMSDDALPPPLRTRATAPATCGDAIDVPLIVFVAVLEFFQA